MKAQTYHSSHIGCGPTTTTITTITTITTQPTKQPTNQPTNQPTDQPTNQPTTLTVVIFTLIGQAGKEALHLRSTSRHWCHVDRMIFWRGPFSSNESSNPSINFQGICHIRSFSGGFSWTCSIMKRQTFPPILTRSGKSMTHLRHLRLFGCLKTPSSTSNHDGRKRITFPDKKKKQSSLVLESQQVCLEFSGAKDPAANHQTTIPVLLHVSQQLGQAKIRTSFRKEKLRNVWIHTIKCIDPFLRWFLYNPKFPFPTIFKNVPPGYRVATVRREATVVYRQGSKGDLLKAESSQLTGDTSEAHLSHLLDIGIYGYKCQIFASRWWEGLFF